MEYKTKSGYALTNDMIEEMGEACERGEYPGEAGVTIVPDGRSPIHLKSRRSSTFTGQASIRSIGT